MKTITYENSADDLFALQKHFKKHLPMAKKNRRTFRILYIIFLTIAGITIMSSAEAQRMTLVAIFVLFLWAGAAVMFAFRHLIRRRVKNNPQEFFGKGFVGQHHLHLLGDQLQEEHSMGTSSLFYEGIYRVDETADHLFIFNSERSAFIVPKQKINGEQFEPFKAHLQAQLPLKVAYTEFE